MLTARHRIPFAARHVLAALSVTACTSALAVAPPATHAQSVGMPVWVVDDITAQSPCTAPQGGPCAAGSYQVLSIYHMGMSAAQAEHRDYLPGDAQSAQLDAFVQAEAARTHRVTVAKAGAQHLGPRTYMATRPVSLPQVGRLATGCNTSGTESLGSVTLSWGAQVSAYLNYNTNGCQVSPQWFSHGSVNSTPAYSTQSPQIRDGSGQKGYFGITGQGCSGITNAVHLQAQPPTGLSISNGYTYAVYASGSHCTGFDTTNAVNWYW